MTHVWVALAVAGLIMCAGATAGAVWSYRRLTGMSGAALSAACFALAVSGVAATTAAVIGAL